MVKSLFYFHLELGFLSDNTDQKKKTEGLRSTCCWEDKFKSSRHILIYNFFLFWYRELNPEVCSTISDTLCFMTELQ